MFAHWCEGRKQESNISNPFEMIYACNMIFSESKSALVKCILNCCSNMEAKQNKLSLKWSWHKKQTLMLLYKSQKKLLENARVGKKIMSKVERCNKIFSSLDIERRSNIFITSFASSQVTVIYFIRFPGLLFQHFFHHQLLTKAINTYWIRSPPHRIECITQGSLFSVLLYPRKMCTKHEKSFYIFQRIDHHIRCV